MPRSSMRITMKVTNQPKSQANTNRLKINGVLSDQSWTIWTSSNNCKIKIRNSHSWIRLISNINLQTLIRFNWCLRTLRTLEPVVVAAVLQAIKCLMPFPITRKTKFLTTPYSRFKNSKVKVRMPSRKRNYFCHQLLPNPEETLTYSSKHITPKIYEPLI